MSKAKILSFGGHHSYQSDRDAGIRPRIERRPRTYSMQSFREWLERRAEEVHDATTLVLAIARCGAAGVSVDRLRRTVGLAPDTLDDLLRALTATG